MKKTVIWLLALLLLCTAARATTLPAGLTEISEGAFEGDTLLQGVIVLPEGTQAVGERAFADTDVHALAAPAGCTLAPDVLSGAEAAYIRLAQYAELDGAVLDDVAYVFVDEAAEDAAPDAPYILTSDTLTDGGIIYLRAEDGLYPLCPEDRTALPETVVIPKQLGGQPVIGLDMLVMPGCGETELLVPAYMEIPQGLNAAAYATMSAVVSAGEAEALTHDTEAVFEAIAQGAYGAFTVQWTFTLGEETDAVETEENVCGYVPLSEGMLTVTAVVTDELGDAAQAEAVYAVRCGAVQALPLGQSAAQAGQEAVFTAEAVCGCLEPAYAAVWTVTYGEEAVPVISETSDTLTWSFVPEMTGMYVIAVQVTDAYGNTASADGVLDVVCGGVTAEAPSADVPPALETETVFTVNAACDCGITGYVWTITDGTSTETFETTEPSLPWTPSVPGSYTLTVTAADAAENTAEAFLAFTVPCRGVTAEAPIADVPPALETETVFTVNAVCDCEITGYVWTVTDGTNTETYETMEPSLPWTPSVPGSYTLMVTASDAAENMAEASLAFTVPCRGVTAEAPMPETALIAGVETNFVVEADCDCAITAYHWTFVSGTETTAFTTTEGVVAYTPATVGAFTVTVVIEDASGAALTVETTCEAVCGVQVTAPVTTDEAAIGTEMTFTTVASCGCEIVSYTWEMTDTVQSTTVVTTEPVLTFTPQYADIFTLTVTAEDAYGETAEASCGFTVPCAGMTLGAPEAVDGLWLGEASVLSVPASCDCIAMYYYWMIQTEDTFFSVLTTEPVLSYTPETAQPHQVMVSITDALGNNETVEATIGISCSGVTVLEPEAESEPVIGAPAVFVTEALCDCEIVSYAWTITDGDLIIQETTQEPVFTYTPVNEKLVVSVTATDSLGGHATACTEYTLADYGEPVYRAVLIGNTYPDTDSELAGCDTDVYAMRSMLRSMTGTPFTVTARTNQTASGIQSAISSAFDGADANDVSLFYYSGHGTSTGMLVGTSGTYVAAANLRTWLDQVPGTKIVILDCCYSGMTIAKSAGDSASSFNSAIISAFSWVSREGELATNGYYVLTACSKNQKSLSLSDGTISFGAFTYSLCYGCGYDEWNQEALSDMPADDNGDGAITISEAISGIRSRISYLSTMVTLNQAMQYYGDTSYTLWSK